MFICSFKFVSTCLFAQFHATVSGAGSHGRLLEQDISSSRHGVPLLAWPFVSSSTAGAEKWNVRGLKIEEAVREKVQAKEKTNALFICFKHDSKTGVL